MIASDRPFRGLGFSHLFPDYLLMSFPFPPNTIVSGRLIPSFFFPERALSRIVHDPDERSIGLHDITGVRIGARFYFSGFASLMRKKHPVEFADFIRLDARSVGVVEI